MSKRTLFEIVMRYLIQQQDLFSNIKPRAMQFFQSSMEMKVQGGMYVHNGDRQQLIDIFLGFLIGENSIGRNNQFIKKPTNF